MPTEVEQQEQAERDLQNQSQQKIEAIKAKIGEDLDKFGQELFAHLKSTGQTRRSQSQDQLGKDRDKELKAQQEKDKNPVATSGGTGKN
jgi:hypothetical protein